MTDSRDGKPGPMRRMDDRTVPVPVPRGGTLTADTLEANPSSFIGEDHLAAEAAAPHAESDTRAAERPAPPPAQPSFDEEIARHAAPAPRPAVRRGGALSSSSTAAGRHAAPAPALRHSATAEPTSDVFAARQATSHPLAPAALDAPDLDGSAIAEAQTAVSLERAAVQSARARADLSDADAATVPVEAPRTAPLQESAEPEASATASLATASSAPVASAADAADAPTIEQTAALLMTPPDAPPPPVGGLPDRVSPRALEDLANDATRIRSKPNDAAPREPARGGKRLLTILVPLIGLGVTAAAATALRRPPTEMPEVVAAASRAATVDARAREGDAAAPPALPRRDDARDLPPPDLEAQPGNAGARAPRADESALHAATRPPVTASDQPDPVGVTREDKDAATPSSALRRGFFDTSGSGALGLAQALEAGVRGALRESEATGLVVRGEVRKTSMHRGEATLDCRLIVADARAQRVTLQTSARAAEPGQKPDRLLRIAAERCGKNLAPELAQELKRLARR